MKLVQIIEYLRKRLRQVVWICVLLLVALVVLDAIPALVHKEHAHTEIETLPGFWAVFGFVGCALLILASKAFGHTGVMTREEYYDE